MKKFLLSLSLIISFLLYSLQQRFGQEENLPIIIPSQPISSSAQISSPITIPTTSYKDGQYTGDLTDAYYGLVQVKVNISGGKITDVQFLQYPNDRRTSITINTQAMPYLRTEAIAAQDSQVDTITGATQTSGAFRRSLKSALDQAKI